MGIFASQSDLKSYENICSKPTNKMLAAKCGREQIETEHLPWQTMANQMINSDKPRTPKYTYIYVI